MTTSDERPHLAAAAVEQRRDALVDAELDEPRHGQSGGDADRDQRRGRHQRAVVGAHEVGQQRPAPAAQQAGQAAGDLLDVLHVDASPRVDQLVAGEVEGGVGVDVVDLVGLDGGHGALTSSDSSERTAR